VYAIFESERGRLIFSETIEAGFSGRRQEGVTLAALPPCRRTLSAVSDRSDTMVGVSSDDCTCYRVFWAESDMEGSGFRPTGLSYGGTFTLFPLPPLGEYVSTANGPDRLLVPPSPVGSGDWVADFRTIVADHEADQVRAACQAEGFGLSLSERIMAHHLREPSCLDLAERAKGGVAHYVRCLARQVSSDDSQAPSPP